MTGTKSNENAQVEYSRVGKYLAFRLGSVEFGIQVLKVREIIRVQDSSAVPKTPAYLKGVINLRGKVIPVIDFRIKFGLEQDAYTWNRMLTHRSVASLSSKWQGRPRQLKSGVVVDGSPRCSTLRFKILKTLLTSAPGKRFSKFLGW